MASGSKNSGKTVEDVFKSGMDDMIRAREEMEAAGTQVVEQPVVVESPPVVQDPILSGPPIPAPVPEPAPSGPPMSCLLYTSPSPRD